MLPGEGKARGPHIGIEDRGPRGYLTHMYLSADDLRLG